MSGTASLRLGQAVTRVAGLLALAAFLAQGALGHGSAARVSLNDTLPPAPGAKALRTGTLGDGEFAYRSQTLRLQHLGNLGGDLTPLRQMDYPRVTAWLRTLDRLNGEAAATAVTAAYLYGGTPRRDQVLDIVDYLAERGRDDVAANWRWLATAVYLARYRAEAPARALEVARLLSAADPDQVPPWARQLELFLLTQMGDREAATAFLARLLESMDEMSNVERAWVLQYMRQHGLD